MSMTEALQKDGLWQKVRSLLGRHAERRDARRPASSAGARKRHSAARPIEEELQKAWMLAAERNVSLCVVALEIDCFGEYLAAYGRDAAEDCLETLERLIVSLLKREEDTCLRLGQSGFLLVLPDMPMLMGRDLVNKINQAVRREGLVNKESHAGAVTLGAGLAVVNPEPPFAKDVLDTAKMALRKAQRHGLARLEIADMRMGEKRDVAA
ncbi:diguanylate cyclase domain-containing protein [Devosia sp. Root685]|uniref:diguanylate cyclase domain-containing protein n=1 Tax=Devosia sp. Root685 TaxID=1736587 RepID=UPI0009EAD921|nr:diguanylate cyclase [Devosia sp. Root685]